MITIHVQKREAEHILNRIDSTPKGIELVGVDIDLAKYNIDLSDGKIRIYKKPPPADPMQEQHQPTDIAVQTGMIQVTSLAELKLHNFCESKIQSATVADKPVDKLSYSNIMRVMYSAIGSADEVMKTTTTNIKPGKLTGKGFKYFEPMDFSCQGVDANSAAREILHMSLTHSISIDMVIGLVTGDTVNMRNLVPVTGTDNQRLEGLANENITNGHGEKISICEDNDKLSICLREQIKSKTGMPIYKMVDIQTRNTIIENINSGILESECLTGKKQKWWLRKHYPDDQIPKRIYELKYGTIKELYDKYVTKFGAMDWAVFTSYTRELIKQKIMIV